MIREERVKICETCQHQLMDINRGIVCKLTNEDADFEGKCDKYVYKYGSSKLSESSRNDDNIGYWGILCLILLSYKIVQFKYALVITILCVLVCVAYYKIRRCIERHNARLSDSGVKWPWLYRPKTIYSVTEPMSFASVGENGHFLIIKDRMSSNAVLKLRREIDKRMALSAGKTKIGQWERIGKDYQFRGNPPTSAWTATWTIRVKENNSVIEQFESKFDYLTEVDWIGIYEKASIAEKILQSAQNGDMQAQAILGCCYAYMYNFQHTVLQHNASLAVHWWLKAADNGYRIAQRELAIYSYNNKLYSDAKFWNDKLDSKVEAITRHFFTNNID